MQRLLTTQASQQYTQLKLGPITVHRKSLPKTCAENL
jgi:hypothetical protein